MKTGLLITGATGGLGSRICRDLLLHTDANLYLIVRASSSDLAFSKFEQAMQKINFDIKPRLLERITILCGDLSAPQCGIDTSILLGLREQIASVIHTAACVNRISISKNMQHNILATQHLLKLTQKYLPNMQRFTFISTVTIYCKKNTLQNLIPESEMRDFNQHNLDIYSWSKLLSEELLKAALGEKLLVARPSFLLPLGADSQKNNATNFSTLFRCFSKIPIVPLSGDLVVDVVDIDKAALYISMLHLENNLEYSDYNISAGCNSPQLRSIAQAVANKKSIIFINIPYRVMLFLLNTINVLVFNYRFKRQIVLFKIMLEYIHRGLLYDNARLQEFLKKHTNP